MATIPQYERQFYDTSVRQEGGVMKAAAGAVEATAGIIVQQKTKQEELKQLNLAAQADVEMRRVTNELRNKHADNPADIEVQNEFSNAYDKVFSAYDKQIGSGFRAQWMQTRDKLKQKYNLENQQWVMAQNVKNADRNVNEGIQVSLSKGYELGVAGDMDGALRSFADGETALRSAASGLVPADKLNEDMKTYKSDYMKSFLMGMVQNNPEKALGMLDDKVVTDALDSNEIHDTLKKMASVQGETIKLKAFKDQMGNQVMFDEQTKDMPIGAKLQMLENGAKAGKYDADWSKSMTNMMLSEKGVDATTQADVADDIGARIAIINDQYGGANGKLTANDYLTESRKLSIEINDAISQGKLRADDGKTLSAKIAKEEFTAVKNVKAPKESTKFRFKNAKKMFDTFSPVNSNAALREYYYDTDGMNLTSEEKQRKASEIASRYEDKERIESLTLTYHSGKEYTFGGRKFIVTGKDEAGNPLFEEKK